MQVTLREALVTAAVAVATMGRSKGPNWGQEKLTGHRQGVGGSFGGNMTTSQ